MLVGKKQNSQHMNPYLWKKNNVDYGIIAPLVANKANVGKCPLQWKGGQLRTYLFQYLYTSDLWVASYMVQLYNKFVIEC